LGIMIIDDCPDNRLLLRHILRAAGYQQLLLAESALDAFEQINSWGEALQLRAIFLDILMPGMDGIEACARIRQVKRLEQVPVIMVSAKNGSSDKAAAFAAGATHYISKPIDRQEIMSCVRELLPGVTASAIAPAYIGHIDLRKLLDKIQQHVTLH